MIDFSKELEKFRPLSVIDDIESSIANEELQDIMDLLKEVGNNSYNRSDGE